MDRNDRRFAPVNIVFWSFKINVSFSMINLSIILELLLLFRNELKKEIKRTDGFYM